MAVSNTVKRRRFYEDSGLHEINATVGSFVALKNSVTKLSTDLQNERERVKMIDDEFLSLKVELVEAWFEYHNFVSDSSNENWDLFRVKLHQIFISVGVNMDCTHVLEKENSLNHSAQAKFGLAHSFLLPPE